MDLITTATAQRVSTVQSDMIETGRTVGMDRTHDVMER
jgi:hypothetical protein